MIEKAIQGSYHMSLDHELITILNSDWSFYEERKELEGSNIQLFNCMNSWEVDYLVEKISATNVNYTDKKSRRAITIVCMASFTPSIRHVFIEHVIGVLYLL
jgi:hypothetical protein